MEIWKTIKDFDDYQISNLGNVKSLKYGKERILKQNFNSKYKFFLLRKSGNIKMFYLHRLIALHFIPNTDNKNTVNHINGIKIDNRIENLEWCTQKENVQHAVKNGLNNVGKRSMKKIINSVDSMEFDSVISAAKYYNISKNYLSNMLTEYYPNNTNLKYKN